MSGSVTIRRAEPNDGDALLTMMREIAGAEAVGTVERDGAAIGYVPAVRRLNIWAGRSIIALDDLYVRAAHRDGGVGGGLMTAVAEVAAPGQRIIRWEVESDNHAAQRFCERLGASLWTKTIAAWRPEAYRSYVGRVPAVV